MSGLEGALSDYVVPASQFLVEEMEAQGHVARTSTQVSCSQVSGPSFHQGLIGTSQLSHRGWGEPGDAALP